MLTPMKQALNLIRKWLVTPYTSVPLWPPWVYLVMWVIIAFHSEKLGNTDANSLPHHSPHSIVQSCENQYGGSFLVSTDPERQTSHVDFIVGSFYLCI